MIYENLLSLVGKTPLLEASRFFGRKGVLCKLEYFNPASSVKDRVGVKMIEDAEKSGVLKKGATIIEPTSGNTGIGIAMAAAIKGYKAVLTMPETMSSERRKLLAMYGAKIVLTPASEGMSGAVRVANELCEKTDGAVILGQFDNKSNALAHYETTGPELWQDTEGKIDVLIACAGTGGTVTGTAMYLKEQNPDIEIIAVEPESSPLLSKGVAGAHKIQGIGANFIPSILDLSIIDKIETCSDNDAFECSRAFAKTEGALVGISSGAALAVAKRLCGLEAYKNKTIAVILPDTGERYISTELFDI